jgi:hypothetical protein
LRSFRGNCDVKAPKRDFSSFSEEAMPNLPFFGEMAARIKEQIHQAMRAIGKLRQARPLPLGKSMRS